MRLVVGHDVAVANWCAKKLGGEENSFVPPYRSLGIVDKGGRLRGAFVIRPHNNTACELSLYSEGVLTHGVMRGMFRMMFEAWEFSCCLIHTPRTNKAIKRAAPKMGFKFTSTVESFYGVGDDALQYTMTPNSCRWLKNHGLTFQQAETA